MDGSRFDAWTRRRFGVVAAAAITGWLGLAARDGTVAKRKKAPKQRRKRQCEKLNTKCNPGNDRKLCCAAMACGLVPELGGHHCCQQRYGACGVDADCCNNLVCTGGSGGFCDNSV